MPATLISSQALALVSGSATLTVPSDCTDIYITGSYYNATAGANVTTATVNGSSPSHSHQLANGTPTDAPATFAFHYNGIPTGSRTLAMTFSHARTEGPTLVATYTKGGPSTGWRDVKSAHGAGSTALSVTLTTAVGDLVLKHDQRNDGANNPPSTSAGWNVSSADSNVNGEHSSLTSIVATATTQVCNSEDENYSTLVAFSIGAGASTETSSGALVSQASSLSGTATRNEKSSGTPVSQNSSAAGTGKRNETSTGTPSSQVAIVAGSGKRNEKATGSIASQASVAAGAAKRLIISSGVIVAQISHIAGSSLLQLKLLLTTAQGQELRDQTGALVTVSGVIWQWYDAANSTSGVPVDSGTVNIVSGQATIQLPNSVGAIGDHGTLVLFHPSNAAIRGVYNLQIN